MTAPISMRLSGIGTSSLLHRPKGEGWQPLYDDSTAGREVDLEFLCFMQGYESYVNGATVINRAQRMAANGGQQVLERMLEFRRRIPGELQMYDRLVGASTLWSIPGTWTQCLPSLVFRNGKWEMEFWMVSNGFWGWRDCVVRVRSLGL